MDGFACGAAGPPVNHDTLGH